MPKLDKYAQIEVVGNRAYINSEVDPKTELWLRDVFCWAPILDLPALTFFYKKGKMVSGVSEFVKEALESEGYAVDYTVRAWENPPYKHPGVFTGESYRPKQREAIDEVMRRKRGIVHAPPGFGKTLIMAVAGAESCHESLIVVQAKEPFDQCVKAIKEFTDITDIGMLGAGQDTLGRITVATIQTLHNRIKKGDQRIIEYLDRVGFLAIDEGHHGTAASYKAVFDAVHNVEYLIAVSATPFRSDDKSLLLHVMYGPIIFDVPYTTLVEEKVLCPLKIFVETAPLGCQSYGRPRNKFHARNMYQQIYREYVIQNENRNKIGVDFAKSLNERGHSCALIVSRVEHIEELKRLMPHAAILHGKTPREERTELWEALRDHRVMTVVSTLLDEAVDITSLGGVALMAAGKSKVKLIQRLRSTRVFSGTLADGTHYEKKKGFVLYINDQAPMLQRHSQENIRELKKLAKTSEHIELVIPE